MEEDAYVPQARSIPPPGAVTALGPAATAAWATLAGGSDRRPQARAAYQQAVLGFLAWLEPQGIAVAAVTPGQVAAYFDEMDGSVAVKKFHFAALRAFFGALRKGRVLARNPAILRGAHFRVAAGRAPAVTMDQARRLLESITPHTRVGLRDKAVLAVLIFSAADPDMLSRVRVGHLTPHGAGYRLRLDNDRGWVRDLPIGPEARAHLDHYLRAAHLRRAPQGAALFRATLARTDCLKPHPMTGYEIRCMVRRRLDDARLPAHLSADSFRSLPAAD